MRYFAAGWPQITKFSMHLSLGSVPFHNFKTSFLSKQKYGDILRRIYIKKVAVFTYKSEFIGSANLGRKKFKGS
jgi:hypothetical protein